MSSKKLAPFKAIHWSWLLILLPSCAIISIFSDTFLFNLVHCDALFDFCANSYQQNFLSLFCRTWGLPPLIKYQKSSTYSSVLPPCLCLISFFLPVSINIIIPLIIADIFVCNLTKASQVSWYLSLNLCLCFHIQEESIWSSRL